MTTKEIKLLLDNIFGVEFVIDNITPDYFTYNNNKTDFINVYLGYSFNNYPIWINIFPSPSNYDKILNILNENSNFGFIQWSSSNALNIEFILYNEFKNIDI